VLLVLGLSAIGTGAILLSRGGSRPREVGLDTPGTSPKPSHAPGAVTGT
jgi:hypothetical protein